MIHSGFDISRVKNQELLELFGALITCYKCDKIAYDPYFCEDCQISICSGCLEQNIVKCLKCKSKNISNNIALIRNFLKELIIKCLQCQNEFLYYDIIKHEETCKNLANPEDSFVNISKADFCNSEVISENQIISIQESNSKDDKAKIEKEDFSSLHNELELKDQNSVILQDIQETHSILSEHEDRFSQVSLNFIDSLKLNNEWGNMKITQEKNEKDIIIANLSERVSKLESICTYLIKELTTVKTTFKYLNNANLNNSINPINHQELKDRNHLNSVNNQALKPSIQQNTKIGVYVECENCKKITKSTSQSKCLNCKKQVCLNCLMNCVKCNEISCIKCSNCNICQKREYCYKCKYPCSQCISDNSFCSKCLEICEICNQTTCKKCCSFNCKECSKLSCLKCVWNCKYCFNTNCKNESNSECQLCTALLCQRCNKSCKKCQKVLCKGCIKYCKKCTFEYCKGCIISIRKEEICDKCL